MAKSRTMRKSRKGGVSSSMTLAPINKHKFKDKQKKAAKSIRSKTHRHTTPRKMSKPKKPSSPFLVWAFDDEYKPPTPSEPKPMPKKTLMGQMMSTIRKTLFGNGKRKKIR